MADSTINNRVWQIATVLRGDGVTYSDYLEQITFMLFLKMVDENSQLPDRFRWKGVELPEDCKWKTISALQGQELLDHYSEVLTKLSKQDGMIGEIYRRAQNKIAQPTNIRKVVDMIDSINWNSQTEDVKGDIYESLLDHIAQDTKSGAGQYFTPRPLVNIIIRCVNPQLGKTIDDPCCGSGGFLLASKDYLDKQKPTGEQEEFLKNSTFSGTEIVASTFRLCLMNLLLHNIGKFGGVPPIKCADSLASKPNGEDLRDYVLTNPPFGTKSSIKIEVMVKDKKTGEMVTKLKKENNNYVRDDFITTTSNKQLNFMQHIKSMLKIGGTAAVVVPDSVLTDEGSGEVIRKSLLSTCDLHTILRLPDGIFYAKGVKTNVLFFEKKPTSSEGQTKEVWVYDYRTNIKHTLKKKPLKEENLEEFVKCYNPQDRHHRQETYNAETNPNGRWRKFSIEEILARDKTALDIKWIGMGEEDEDYSLTELLSDIEVQGNSIYNAVSELQALMSEISKE